MGSTKKGGPQMIKKSEICNKLKDLDQEEKKRAYKLLDKLKLDVYEGDKRLTGVKPSGFYLEGKFYAVEHHRQIFLKVAEIAASKHPTEIVSVHPETLTA